MSKPLKAGQLVRKARLEVQMTPRILCNRIGMTVAHLSDIERGIQHLSLRRAQQMANVFGLPFDQIVASVLQDRLDEVGFANLKVIVQVAEGTAALSKLGDETTHENEASMVGALAQNHPEGDTR